jgi:A/G-specific adenine glycosylase
MRSTGPSAAETAKFRSLLLEWFSAHKRDLPWRATREPYLVWVSEIMLQQTRVNAVLGHYERFTSRFPTLVSLALAKEEDVLAAWSGLGYYRRARMLYHAAQFILREHGGMLPHTPDALRRLPGIGVYTAAAVASIAFGEPIAVVDGNVQRVIQRLFATKGTAGMALDDVVRRRATALLDPQQPGDFNQAMMELGATVCTPKSPQCSVCPVRRLCATQGEHVTIPRAKMRSVNQALAVVRRRTPRTQSVGLVQRAADLSLMPGMWELPLLPEDFSNAKQPELIVRHSITNTNYYVSVYEIKADEISQHLKKEAQRIKFVQAHRLEDLPLTGLARKVLMRLEIMPSAGRRSLAEGNKRP